MFAFTTYKPLCLMHYKTNVCDKNISKRKYEKLRDHLFKNEIFLEKGLNKRSTFFDKIALG